MSEDKFSSESNSDRFQELKVAWIEIKTEFKRSPLISLSFYIFLLLYVFTYFYSNGQNPSKLLTSAWFYDAMILSWTNLLIIPLVVVVIPWNRGKRDWSSVKWLAKLHLASPLIWIAGIIVMRLASKLIVSVIQGLGLFFSWLAS